MNLNNIPATAMPGWVLKEKEKVAFLRAKGTYQFSIMPNCVFYQKNRIDPIFIEGYMSSTSEVNNLHHTMATQYDYIGEHVKGNDVYITFDKRVLYRVSEIMPTQPITFILKKIESAKAIVRNRAFMIMPFRYKQLNTFYQQSIRQFLLDEMEIEIFRSDDFNNNDIVIETIYNQIEEAEFIIAETTKQNKNVFYEIGYAASKDKEIIGIQNSDVEQSLYFDRGHIRTLMYSTKNIKDFQRQLKNTITAVRDKMSARN